MSVVLLVVLGVAAYTLLVLAFGSWLGRRLAQDRRGGYIDWTLTGSMGHPTGPTVTGSDLSSGDQAA